MAELPGILMPHTVTVRRAVGEGSEGPVWAPPVAVRCRVEGRIDVDAEGNHVGSVKVYTRLRYEDVLNVGAKISTPGGGSAVVTAVAVHADGDLGAWQHLEVSASGEAG